MQVIDIVLARTVWFFDLKAINPSGLASGPVHTALKDRYKFLLYPSTVNDFDLTKGVKYASGEFLFDGRLRAVTLSVFNNGCVADTLVSTEASEALLEDSAKWLSTLGYEYAKKLVTTVGYESQVVIKSNIDLSKQFANAQHIVSLISELSGNPTLQVSGFVVGASDNYLKSTFYLERRVTIPFSENQYFSTATLPTSKHLQILNALEKSVG